MEEDLKIKPLTKQQILISLDRLTRFKNTEDKYLRVFKDLIASNLIYPKYKKSQLDNYEMLADLAAKIINHSIQALGIGLSNEFTINKKLYNYENSTFKIDSNTKKLLENKIDYKSAIKLINTKDYAINLKWLKSLEKEKAANGVKFPIKKIVIAEGITEEILLPKFAKILEYDFNFEGINVISAGGKNQVVKLFYYYADILKLPIFVLLDQDAEENHKELIPKLRKSDKVHVIKCGEFEDILPHDLIKRTLNNYLKNFATVKEEELELDSPMTEILEGIFKTKGFGEFKKAEFATMVADNLKEKDISQEISNIIDELKTL